jgi:hypothetical protein
MKMATNTKEAALRDFLRKLMPKKLEWIEPTRGSTVGLPDVNISHGNMSVPTELKHWEWKRKGLYHPMRPAQIRYHTLAYRDGKKTAIMFSTPDKHLGCHVWMIPNKLCPKDDYGLESTQLTMIGNPNANPDMMVRAILECFKSSNWWSGK